VTNDPRRSLVTLLDGLDAARAREDVQAAQALLRELPGGVAAWLTDPRDAAFVASLVAYADRWTAIQPRPDDFFNALSLVLASLRERLDEDHPK